MFTADRLLIERARIAALAMTDGTDCAVSEPLGPPYQGLRLAVFRGEAGARLAAEVRERRSLVREDRAYRPVADLSADLGLEDALVVEPA